MPSALAAESHHRAHAATESGAFADEIFPVEVKDRKGNVTVVGADEGIRADVTSDEGRYRTFEFSPGDLVTGTNTLAVEVHQANATSSDVSFDFELNATPLVAPKFYLGGNAEAPMLIWAGEGFAPQMSTDLDGWTSMPEAASPMLIEPEPGSARIFYRLGPEG